MALLSAVAVRAGRCLGAEEHANDRRGAGVRSLNSFLHVPPCYLGRRTSRLGCCGRSLVRLALLCFESALVRVFAGT